MAAEKRVKYLNYTLSKRNNVALNSWRRTIHVMVYSIHMSSVKLVLKKRVKGYAFFL